MGGASISLVSVAIALRAAPPQGALYPVALSLVRQVIADPFRMVEQDLDTIHECLDCKEAFSLWQWRHTCAGCANSFCKKCLERRHIVDTSVPPVPPLPKAHYA